MIQFIVVMHANCDSEQMRGGKWTTNQNVMCVFTRLTIHVALGEGTDL